MTEYRNVSIADRVFEDLERDILSGKYERGEVMTETKLSEMLGVSRTPIREAMRRLGQEHLVEIGPKGAVVVGISAEDIDVIYEMRLRIEGMASRLAALRIQESDAALLRNILDLQEFYTSKKNADVIKNEDSEFHRELYRLSGCTPLADTLSALHRKVLKYRRASVSNTGRAEKSLEEHRAILEAVASHNADLAEELTVLHVKNARESIKNRGVK